MVEQADEMLKSSCNHEFLGLDQAVLERDLEKRLLAQLKKICWNWNVVFSLLPIISYVKLNINTVLDER